MNHPPSLIPYPLSLIPHPLEEAMSELEKQPKSKLASGEGGSERPCRVILFMAAALLAVLIASHWGTIGQMIERWTRDPQYSHGFVVPVFALVVLWSRRKMVERLTWQPAWLGLGLLVVGAIMRFLAVQSDIEPLDALSLLPTAFGLVLLVGGWSVLGWSWPALAFLAFMIPLPFTIESALALPLRRVAAQMSTFSLQTLGCPAAAEGNIIFIEDIRLGVEEACSGLGMLMTFFALAAALAMIVNAPLHDRLILVASAIPIALLANVIRITATGVAYHLGGQESPLAAMIYHDLAGRLMMPMALAMLWLELKFLSHLFVDEPETGPLPIRGQESAVSV
jgi:exosortase